VPDDVDGVPERALGARVRVLHQQADEVRGGHGAGGTPVERVAVDPLSMQLSPSGASRAVPPLATGHPRDQVNSGLRPGKTRRKKDQQSIDPTAHPPKVEPLYQ
jgi:hypothetical protein